MFIRAFLVWMQPQLTGMSICIKTTRGVRTWDMADNPFRSGRMKHIHARLRFIKELIKTDGVKPQSVKSE